MLIPGDPDHQNKSAEDLAVASPVAHPAQDKASSEYWSKVWEGYELPSRIDPRTATYLNRNLHSFFSRHLQHSNGLRLIEIGCAASAWLPYFAREFGVLVAGIDYSELGCEMSRRILRSNDIPGDIYFGDAFKPPAELLGSFDVVVSLGVVEHFTDTAATLASFARYARPGGLVLTTIPNLAGWIGDVQKRLDRSVYDKHVPLTRDQLITGCKNAGLQVRECEYIAGATDFSICNLNDTATDTATYRRKLFVCKVLVRASRLMRHMEITATRRTASGVVCAASV